MALNGSAHCRAAGTWSRGSRAAPRVSIVAPRTERPLAGGWHHVRLALGLPTPLGYAAAVDAVTAAQPSLASLDELLDEALSWCRDG